MKETALAVVPEVQKGRVLRGLASVLDLGACAGKGAA